MLKHAKSSLMMTSVSHWVNSLIVVSWKKKSLNNCRKIIFLNPEKKIMHAMIIECVESLIHASKELTKERYSQSKTI